jgi:hypothetical protein
MKDHILQIARPFGSHLQKNPSPWVRTRDHEALVMIGVMTIVHLSRFKYGNKQYLRH